jgi:hypothetical protein
MAVDLNGDSGEEFGPKQVWDGHVISERLRRSFHRRRSGEILDIPLLRTGPLD